MVESLNINGTESYEVRDTFAASTVTMHVSGDLTLTSVVIYPRNGFGFKSGGRLIIENGSCLS